MAYNGNSAGKQPASSYHGDDLPQYSASAPPESSENGEGPSERYSDAVEGPRSSKTSYALTLQKACDKAIRTVKGNHIVANSNWAAPLSTAPSAIATMAILFKVADQECAAGLEVDSLEIMDLDNVTLRGKLPSTYFRTNLQHCSDLGRQAFLEAQHSMATIRATARSLIAEEGSIGYIIDLLEDPDDAKYNLKPEIDAVTASASKCHEAAKAITAKFQYWHLVITHLKQASLTKNEQVIKQRNETKQDKRAAKESEKKWVREKLYLEDKIEEARGKLFDAEQDVKRAIVAVETERTRPLVMEPSALDELEKAKRMVRVGPLQERSRGWFVSVKDTFIGQSDSHRTEDHSDRMAHEAHVRNLEDQIMAKARAQRDYQRHLAEKALQEALAEEEERRDELRSAYQELSDSKFQLKQAEENLSRTKLDLRRLSDKVVELRDIMTILENSAHHLGTLKDQIEPLLKFFKEDLEQGIGHTADEDVKAFLRPIQNRMKASSDNPEDAEAFRLSKRSKEKMLSAALNMQGRFSAIADISNAYIDVSNTYIRPAISWMERLSTMPKDQWEGEKDRFLTWCDDSMKQIDSLAQQTNQDVDKHVKGSILALQRRAIEAREDED